MLRNRIGFALLVVLLFVFGVVFVYATCHDDSSCEQLDDD